MKRIIAFILTFVLTICSLIGVVFAQDVYKVTFSYNGTAETVEVPAGETVEPIKEPVKEGYTFYRWKDNYMQDTYDFSTPVTRNIVLAAQWKKNKKTDMQEIVAGDLDQSDITKVNPNKEFGLTPEKKKESLLKRIDPISITIAVAGVIAAVCFAIVFVREKKTSSQKVEKKKKLEKGVCHKCGNKNVGKLTTCPRCGATLFEDEEFDDFANRIDI